MKSKLYCNDYIQFPVLNFVLQRNLRPFFKLSDLFFLNFEYVFFYFSREIFLI